MSAQTSLSVWLAAVWLQPGPAQTLSVKQGSGVRLTVTSRELFLFFALWQMEDVHSVDECTIGIIIWVILYVLLFFILHTLNVSFLLFVGFYSFLGAFHLWKAPYLSFQPLISKWLLWKFPLSICHFTVIAHWRSHQCELWHYICPEALKQFCTNQMEGYINCN